MLKEYIEDMSDYDIPDFETEANDEALVLEDDDWEDLIRQTKEDRNEAINDASLQFYICNLVHFSWLFVSTSMSTESHRLEQPPRIMRLYQALTMGAVPFRMVFKKTLPSWYTWIGLMQSLEKWHKCRLLNLRRYFLFIPILKK